MTLGFTTKAANPGTALTTPGYSVAFSPDGAFIAVTHGNTPVVRVYAWSGTAFGSPVSTPGSLPTSTSHVAFSADGAYIALASVGTPYIHVYPWSGAGFGTKFSNPAALPAGQGHNVAFSPDGAWVAVAHATSPFITVYPWSGAGFGTKVADPGILPTGIGRRVAWSPDGAYIALSHSTSPNISVYPWSAGFGTKVADPATLPAGDGHSLAWSPDGAYIAVASGSSPRVQVYPWSAGFGTIVADPATLPTGTGAEVAFSPDGAYIAVAHATTPFVSVYPWSGTFGTKVANPATLPTGDALGIAFSPTSAVAVSHGTAPVVTAYEEVVPIIIAVPAAVVTLSAPVPRTGLIHAVPAAVVTLTAPTPVSGLVVQVPAAVVTLTAPTPYITAVANEDGTPLIGPIRLFLGHFEIGRMEWSMTTEEVLGGVGRATLTVQDRDVDSEWEPTAHMDVLAVIRSSGWRLFHGETMQPSLSLPPGFPWRRWTIACRDYNAALDERLVGAPSGFIWTRPSENDTYRSIDPDALSRATDRITVQQWLRQYFRYPDFTYPDTGTYVGEYIPNSTLGDPDFAIDLQDATTYLRAALEQLASIADVNIQFGLCADDAIRWLAIPPWQDLVGNTDPTDLPAAPYAIVDTNPNGSTIGHGGIEITFDGQAMPEAVYVQGATTYTYDPTLGDAGLVIGGSGWYPNQIGEAHLRQAYLAAPSAWSEARRDAQAEAAMRRALYPTLRGRLIVDGWTDADNVRHSRDGWRPWQLLSITDARLPASMKPGGRFVIQRVATTLLSGTDIRRYEIDFGDGPVGRISQGGRKTAAESVGPLARKPIVMWTADWADFGAIGAGETREVVFTPRNGIGEPWGPPGMSFVVRPQARDADGNIVTGQGSFDPAVVVTDREGKARSTLTAGDQDGLFYEAFLETAVPP